MRRSYVPAEIPNFGRVFDCGECAGIHVAAGPVSVTLSHDAHRQLVALIYTSAANFDAEIARSNPLYGQCNESVHTDPDGDARAARFARSSTRPAQKRPNTKETI